MGIIVLCIFGFLVIEKHKEPGRQKEAAEIVTAWLTQNDMTPSAISNCRQLMGGEGHTCDASVSPTKPMIRIVCQKLGDNCYVEGNITVR